MVRTKPRQTQAERRAGTIRKLLDAATQTLIEVGYSGATVQAICVRAGVSQGGLFRHFESREALMVAVCEDVGSRILADYREKFVKVEDREAGLLEALHGVRAQCQSELNLAWFELMVAARTNERLKKALVPVTKRYYDNIESVAKEVLPEVSAALGDAFRLVVDTVLCIFDGEAIHRFVIEQPEVEKARVQLVSSLLTPR